METLKFSISINAPKEKVWSALWEDANYRSWTAAFSPGSYAKTENWKEGTKVLFLNEDECGIVSTVEKNILNEYMAFKHYGEVRNGIEDTTSEKVQIWNGARETYTLNELTNGTQVKVEMTGNIPPQFKEYFINVWPKALDKLKEITEV